MQHKEEEKTLRKRTVKETESKEKKIHRKEGIPSNTEPCKASHQISRAGKKIHKLLAHSFIIK